MAISIRPLHWARDAEAAAALDASFESDWIFTVVPGPLSFALVERPAVPPVAKRYELTAEELRGGAHALVAEEDGQMVGVAVLALETWNRRAVLSHLFVDRRARGRGAGTALLAEMRQAAAALGARCLWAETQDVNAPAIRFYRRHGFSWCGLDASLYDPKDVPDETALFFSTGLEG